MGRKTLLIAYALWAVGLFGTLGLHRFYLKRWRTGLLYALTAGLLGMGAACDLLALPRLVAEADARAPRAPRPRLRPITARGWLVALVLLAALALSAPSFERARLSMVVWSAGLLAFGLGALAGSFLVPLLAPAFSRLHDVVTGRSPGEPRARLVEVDARPPAADPAPDEAFLPLAAAMALSFAAVPARGEAVSLLAAVGVSAVPLLAGLLLPILRAPASSRYRAARYDAEGRLTSLRPLGARAAASFGFVAILAVLAQAWLNRDLETLGIVAALAIPVILGTYLYLDAHLAKDVERFENAVPRNAAHVPRIEASAP